MKRSILSLTVIFFLAGFSVFGQGNRISIIGTVLDTTESALTGATVLLLQAEDSVLTSFAITDQKGEFLIKKVHKGDYLLQISYLGYQNYFESLPVLPENGDVNMGVIHLQPQTALLDAVIVEAEHTPMMIKKDTIEYNAVAFKTIPNAPVEDLLKKLPGVEVGRDGSIRAQGQNVGQVLVDGKEFFGKDPTIATKNLPADAVDKVQVFDKKTEMEEFSGIDDGRREQTINLKLKEDKKKGYFGNVTGGYGDMGRYEGKANINRFSKKMQLSGIGMLNNTNQQGFSINDYINLMGGIQNMMSGGGGAMKISLNTADMGLPINNGLSNGFVTSAAGGLNLNYDLGKNTELSTSYFYSGIQNDIEREVFRQSLLGEERFSAEEEGTQYSKNNNHRLNFKLNHKIDSFQNITLRSNIGMNDGLSENSTGSSTFNTENVLENSNQRDYNSEGDNLNFDANLTYRRKFNKRGRTFSANVNFGKQANDRYGNLYSENAFYSSGSFLSDTIRQRQAFENRQMDYGARFSFSEPLGKRKYLEFNYSRQNYSNELVKDFFDIFTYPVSGDYLNHELSQHYNRDYIYDRGGLNFKLNRKKFNLTTGLSVQNSQLDGEIFSKELTINKSYTHFLPSFNGNYDFAPTRNLSFYYRTFVQEPSLEQLQPIVDNSDPLNVYIGNPELRPEYHHNMNLHFMSFDQFTFTNIFGSLDANYTTNKITNATTIDSLFRQSIQPINVDKDFRLSGFLSFGTPLKFIKSKINITTNLMYNRGILYVNNLENNADRYITSIDVNLENRKKKDIIDVIAGVKLARNSTHYSISDEQDQRFLSQLYYADITLNLGKTWTIGSTFDYTIYKGETFGNPQEVAIWNASLSRYILKDRRGQLKLSAVDLLNQNIGINRSSNLNYIQDERIRSLGRYFLLSFTYSLSGFGEEEMGGIKITQKRR
ncbi:MAG: TonB-dependent receptor [Bacteroidetes bacterium]|nr:TonB-dependent receptor [Bacteroidota bacterium]